MTLRRLFGTDGLYFFFTPFLAAAEIDVTFLIRNGSYVQVWYHESLQDYYQSSLTSLW